MKKCKHCNVFVNTDRNICPLCLNSLEDLDGKELEHKLYPVHKYKTIKKNMFYKIVTFICIVSAIISLIVNFVTHNEGEKWWSLYVILSVAYLFMLIRGVIVTRTYVIKRLFIQFVSVSLVLWCIDYLSGNKYWALGYVIPLLAIANNTAIVIINLVNKKNYGEGFNCVFLSLICGAIPFILQCFNLIKIEPLWAPLASACYSLVIVFGMFVFAFNATIEEFKKRFHL